ncbi:MAG: cation diffusion facilitator family transporter [Minisyncoccia bacterium]
MKQKIAFVSIIVNTVLAIIKIISGIITNSTSVLAEGAHSFIDVVSSGVGYLAIRIAQKPEDEKHPYGHYKFEVLAGFFITIILLTTGIFIIIEAYHKILEPSLIKIPILALITMFFSAVVNEVMSRLKLYFGKKENSIVLLADGVHNRTDVFSSLVIFIGLIFSRYWIYLDSLLAILVGFYIIVESFSIGKEAIDSLLDSSAGEEIEERIKNILHNKNIQLGSLKTQKKGSIITANLEIILPNNLTVEEATKVSNNLREELMKEINNLKYIAIQIKSHDLENNFYQPFWGHGFGWQRKGRFKKELENAQGRGPEGYCVCPQCGYKVEHQRGVPCPDLICPNCKIPLIRGD